MTLPKKRWILLLLLLAALRDTLAGHPFVTDDTGTQGRGNRQFEANTDWSRQDDTSLHVVNFTYSHGALENLDLFVSLPAAVTAPAGADDLSAGAKWRFYENDGSSLAFKPALRFATGNQLLGHGSGRANLALTLIGSHYAEPWALHANLGATTNWQAADSTRAGERTLLWQASAALSYDLHPRWKMLADIGLARNPDPASRINPAYFLAGLIYSPSKNVDLDTGAKFGLNRAEVDRQFGLGLTWRF